MVAAAAGAGCTSSEAEAEGGTRVELRSDWGRFFVEADVTGTFALREIGSDITMVWDAERAIQRRRPASTFKVLNSLIILETGVLPDVDAVVLWDGVAREVDEWNRDHSLRTAIEVSAVWAYQDLARRVGSDRMQDWVSRAGYGNSDIGGGIDEFWLNGGLRISPVEQLDFLEALVRRDLPFRVDVMDAVADIIVQERFDSGSWSYKTGTALVEEPDLGWLVGTTEVGGRRFVFAMNLDLAPVTNLDDQIDPKVRQTIARQILQDAGALPDELVDRPDLAEDRVVG